MQTVYACLIYCSGAGYFVSSAEGVSAERLTHFKVQVSWWDLTWLLATEVGRLFMIVLNAPVGIIMPLAFV